MTVELERIREAYWNFRAVLDEEDSKGSPKNLPNERIAQASNEYERLIHNWERENPAPEGKKITHWEFWHGESGTVTPVYEDII